MSSQYITIITVRALIVEITRFLLNKVGVKFLFSAGSAGSLLWPTECKGRAQ